jgi:peptidoglycan L-alanyl-D-glutamate endopeptidase CwlK
MTYKLGSRSIENLKSVHPDLKRVREASITDSPVDFTVTEGLRSTARQKALFAQGRSKPGLKVTNKDGVKSISNHQDEADGKKDGKGSAVDLYPFFLGKVQVDHEDTIPKLKQISTHIKKKAKELGIAIVWGGDWKNPYDPPHFELKK